MPKFVNERIVMVLGSHFQVFPSAFLDVEYGGHHRVECASSLRIVCVVPKTTYIVSVYLEHRVINQVPRNEVIGGVFTSLVLDHYLLPHT